MVSDYLFLLLACLHLLNELTRLVRLTDNHGVEDLALIHLSPDTVRRKFPRGIEFTQFTQPVCLPSGEAESPGSECIISGWGKMETGGKNIYKIMYTFVSRYKEI